MNLYEPKLALVSTYACPPVQRVKPIKIPPGFEYVEIISGGKIYFELDGKRHEFGVGTVFWHQAGEYTICETSADDPYRCIVLKFQVGNHERPAPRITLWDTPNGAVEFGKECLQAFHCNDVKLDKLSAYAYATLCWKGFPAKAEIIAPDPLQRAMKFIQNNFALPLDINTIARKAGVSNSTIFILFKEHTKMTPYRFLQKQRLSKARIELTKAQCSIKEIAGNCGFESIEVFYRQFKKETGITPAEYRKKNATILEY